HWDRFLWDGILTDVEQILEQIPRAQVRYEPIIAGLLGLAANMDPNRRGRALVYFSGAIEAARRLRRSGPQEQRLLIGVLESSLARIAGEPQGLEARARSLALALTDAGTDSSQRFEPILRT